MRLHMFFCIALLSLLTATVSAASAGAAPTGLWLNPHNSVAVRTGACGDKLCGWVVGASKEALSDAKDSGVANLLGTELLEDYVPAGHDSWSGTVYVPDMGHHFSSRINQLSARALQIKGCLLGGMICKSQTWAHIDHLPEDFQTRS